MTRKIVASEYLTLDGYMDEPGQWSLPFWSQEAGDYKRSELFASEALLLGRVTYDGFAAVWPTMKDDAGFADKMNEMPKYVASRTMDSATWNATVIRGDAAVEIAKLKDSAGGDLLLSGSGQLFDLLHRRELIDEYRLMVHPFVLGYGGTKRLFTGGAQRSLTLVDSVAFPTGVVLHTYRPAVGPTAPAGPFPRSAR